MAKLRNTTFIGLLWMSGGNGAQAFLHILALMILARLLTPKDFGLIAAAQVIISFSAIFSQLGIGPAIVQRHILDKRHIRVGFTISLLLGISLSVIVALSAKALSSFFHMPELVPLVQVMSVVFLIRSFGIVAESLLQRDLQFRKLVRIELLALGIGYGPTAIVLAWAGYGAWSLVIAHITQYLLNSIFLLKTTPHSKIPLFERSALIDLLNFGGGFTIARIFNYIANQGDNLVVARWLGADALGVYGRAYQLMVAPASILGKALDRVLFPAMAQIQHETVRLRFAYRRGVSLIAFTTLPLSVFLVIFSREIIEVILGNGWEETVLPFQVLAIGTFFRTSYKISESLCRATGAVYRRAWRQCVYAFCVITGAYLGLRWGLFGVSIGVLAAITVNFFLMAQLSIRLTYLRWSSFFAAHISPIILATIVGAVAFWIATILRENQFAAINALVISVIIISLITLALVLLAGRLLMGNDGLWLLETLGVYARGRHKKSKNV